MSESFGERLRRLRKEGTPPEPETPALPQWFLQRRQRPVHEPAPAPPDPRSTLGPPVGLAESTRDEGVLAARVTRWPMEHVHGQVALRGALDADTSAFALLTGDERLRSLDLRRAVFLDIETTGLSGGAGTKAFMVGLGRFDGAEFELWQGFLRGPEEERALLAECAERIADSAGLVSFFGKSFDRHRLEDKMRLHGVRAPFDGVRHLDLYHPFRRLYGTAFEDARLGTMERELCGVRRISDLPGAFAPAAWYDFLSGRAHLLEEVFRHNRDDVLSLVTLATSLGSSLSPPDLAREGLDTSWIVRESARAAALARSHAKARNWRECAAWAGIASTLARDASSSRDLLALRHSALERVGEEAAAAECLACLVEGGRDLHAARAAFELARRAARGSAERVRLATLALELCDELASAPELRKLPERARKLLEPARVRSRTRAPDCGP